MSGDLSAEYYKKELSRLKKENKALQRELEKLVIGKGSANIRDIFSYREEPRDRISAHSRQALLSSRRTYLGYLKSSFLTASFYTVSKRFAVYFRRFRLISTVIKIIFSSFAVIGTGAFLLALLATLVAAIPIVAIFAASTYISLLPIRRKRFKELEEIIRSKNVYLLFPERGVSMRGAMLFAYGGLSRSTDAKTENFVIIISPYHISPIGLENASHKANYSVARLESENICIMRRSSFFAFRKRVLEKLSGYVAFIY